MNVFVYTLFSEQLSSAPDLTPRKFVVEDNVGEGIHVHWRNLRFELSINDFERFADHLEDAREELDGHR